MRVGMLYFLSVLLFDRNRLDDRKKTIELQHEAISIATELSMTSLLERVLFKREILKAKNGKVQGFVMSANTQGRASVEDILTKAEAIKFSAEKIRRTFEEDSAANLPVEIDRWLPESEFVHDQLFHQLDPLLSEGGSVLELDAGTGRLSRLLLDRYSQIEMVLLDFSLTMLDRVPSNLSGYEDRYRIEHRDFFVDEPFPCSGVSAVVSAFALHHGTTHDVYRSVYRRIFEVLKPNGMFANIDHVAGSTRRLTIENASAWREFLDKDIELPTDQFLLGSFAEDHPLPVSRHFAMMSEAGLKDLDVVWKKAIFALYVGSKP